MKGRRQRFATKPHDVSLRDLGLVQLFPLWLVSALLAWKALSTVTANVIGNDAHAYWLTGHHNHLYGVGPGKVDAFLYSPAFATAVWPLTHLSYDVFLPLWIVVEVATFAWLLAPLGWRWAVPLLLLCVPVMTQGQIVGLLCVSAVLGLSHPTAWAFPLLTKITSGLGIIWFAARMEWRALGILIGTVAAVSALSIAITPLAWSDWIHFLLRHGGGSGKFLYLRVTVAVLLTALGAKLHKPWVLAPAMWLASPVFVGIVGFSYLTAIPRLLQVQKADGDTLSRVRANAHPAGP
jgi:hypothetical protein